MAAAARYVALGDSYSSGLGTGSYYPTGGCARSPLAYPPLVQQRFQAAGRPVGFRFPACSGETTGELIAGQLGAVTRKARWVTVTIGANDFGFIGGFNICSPVAASGCDAEADRELRFIQGELGPLLRRVYKAVNRRASRKAKLIAVGYPRLYSGAQCPQSAGTTVAEQARLNGVVDVLAQVQARAARKSGFKYLDVRAVFDPHAVCAPAEWVNGHIEPTGEAYHPSAAGQAGYAELVARRLGL